MKSRPAILGIKREQKQTVIQGVSVAEKQLKEASVRITDARVKVLATLLDAQRAFTHQEVHENLAELDRVTLYRALDCLTDAGLAHKIAGDDRVFRYSAGADFGNAISKNEHIQQHQHGHFKCTRCAQVFCLDSISGVGNLQQALQASLGEGFLSHDIELTIKGWCAACAH